jgi:6-phosphogluconolactonase (cycloisomerase 2 family)
MKLAAIDCGTPQRESSSTNTLRKTGTAAGLLLASIYPLSALASGDPVGAVYTMSNDAGGNSVLVFDRDKSGRLTLSGEFSTGGLGTSSGLGNQGAVILDPSNRWLFVVNAGSNEISVFAVTEDRLNLVDVKDSGGVSPISLTYSHDLLYVLNAGGTVDAPDSITGFRVTDDGMLSRIPGSTQFLSEVSTAPAQITFNSDGDVLVVTEKATNLIDTFTVDDSGVAGPGTSYASEGTTPFGFAIGKRDQLFVSEAAGGAAEQGSVSSYQLGEDGNLSLISSAVPTSETAACWLVVSHDGRFAYTTNAGSNTISGYNVAFDGSISLLDEDGVTSKTGKDSGPLDMGISNDGRNLYTLNGRNDTIGSFEIKEKGGLSALGSSIDVPVSANGLAVR